MNSAFSAAQAWAVVLGVGIPLFVLWWWARRHAPISSDLRDYSVGYRTAEPEAAALASGLAAAAHAPVAMPEGMVDAPVMANPAHLEPPTAVAAPPASIAAEPMPTAALPPEPAGAEPHPAPRPVVVVTAAVLAPVVTSTPATNTVAKPASPIVPAAETLPPVAEVIPPAVPVAQPPPIPPMPATVESAAAKPPPAESKPPVTQVAAAAPAADEPAAPKPTAAPAAPTAATIAAPSAPAAPSGGDDDLSRILNVTPQIVEILHGAGIYSYRELAAADPAHLRELLETAGLQSVDPSTWPQQGRFAAGGKWKQLQNLQTRLAAG